MSLILGMDELVGPWVYSRSGGQWISGAGRTIGWWDEERIKAGYVFSQYNGRNIFVDFAVDSGYLPKALLYAVGAYAFQQLGCTRLTLVAEENNIASVKICSKLGAHLEATLEGAARGGGNVLIFRLTPDCTIWKKLHGKVQQHARVPRSAGDDPAAGRGESASVRSDDQRDAADGSNTLRYVELVQQSVV